VAKTQNVVTVSGSLSGVTNLTTEEAEVVGGGENVQQGAVINKSSEKLIFAFDIPLNPEVIGTLDQTNHIISLVLPFGTDITMLAPMVIISDNATVFPLSDTIQDFSNPIVYQVTAQDGTTQSYTVSAKVLAEEKASEGVQGLPVAVKILLSIAGLSFLIVIILAIFLFIRKKDFFRNLVKKK